MTKIFQLKRCLYLFYAFSEVTHFINDGLHLRYLWKKTKFTNGLNVNMPFKVNKPRTPFIEIINQREPFINVVDVDQAVWK